jgi:hypothetical protein
MFGLLIHGPEELHFMRVRCFVKWCLVVLVAGSLVPACKTRSNSSELREIWLNLLDSKWKAAQEVSDKNEYIRRFETLPLAGALQPAPWSNVIYSNETSGLAKRYLAKSNATEYRLDSTSDVKDSSKLSSIEKYDLLLNHKQWELTLAERIRTRGDSNKSVDPLRSLQQDWAAASLLFAEPSPILVKSDKGDNIAFSSGDIKGLLTRFVSQRSTPDEGVEVRSLGGICRLDSDSYRRALESRTIAKEAWKDLKFDDCFSVNAGAFHLALTNLIGLRAESFIIDPVVDFELNHFPLQAYKSETLGTPTLDDKNHQEIQIKTTVTYIVPSDFSETKDKSPQTKNVVYRYRIELDEGGDIVGGTWLGSESPQLAWMQNRPRFNREDAQLEKLYTTSVSLPSRMAMRNFSSIDTDDPRINVRDSDALAVNKKYRLELSGDVPRGADGLKIFLKSAFRPLGNVSIFRNTFADEDSLMSIEVQFHSSTSVRALKQAIRAHSNGRADVHQILR